MKVLGLQSFPNQKWEKKSVTVKSNELPEGICRKLKYGAITRIKLYCCRLTFTGFVTSHIMQLEEVLAY